MMEFEMFGSLSIYTSVGFLAVLSFFLLTIVMYTWLIRKKFDRLEADMIVYSAELDSMFSNNDKPVPEKFFSRDISHGYNIELLTKYVQEKCLAAKHPHIERIKEYALTVGLTDRLRKQVYRGDPWKRAIALRLLAEVGQEADRAVFREILNHSSFRPLIFAAAIGLANHGITDCIQTIIEKLYNRKKPNRDEVLSIISYFESIAIDPCIELIKKDKLMTPLKATLIDYLGTRRAYSAKPILEDILKKSTDGELNLHTIEALEKVGDRNSCGSILPFLKDIDFRVRLKAVNALERLAADEYLETAEKLLSDPNLFVRRNAAEAITRMGSKGMQKLTELVSSGDRDVSIISKLVLAEQKYGKVRWRFRYGDSIP